MFFTYIYGAIIRPLRTRVIIESMEMKLSSKVLAGVAILGLAITPLVAQRQGWMGGFGAGHFRHDPDRFLEFVSAFLDLTDAQKQFAKTLMTGAKAEAEPVVTQLKQSRASMEEAIKANQSDAEIGDIATKSGLLVGQLAAIHAKAMAKFYAQLTPEQKTKVDRFHDRIQSRFMGRQ
jgi:Spy/CpxP family protein refolding chaperone